MPLFNREPAVIEADFGEGLLEIYVWPANLEELDKIEAAEAAEGGGGFCATILILMARDADQKRIFNRKDRGKIMRTYTPSEVGRVATEAIKAAHLEPEDGIGGK